MDDIEVTIVVSPRERFSYACESLESIYQYTDIPFKLIYVDGNSPSQIKEYLKTKAKEKNFQLIRTEHYLTPNWARNIGFAKVDTKYVAFLDNDVIVSPGWLTALIRCLEENKATVAGPLMCQYEPIHEEIHFAGGDAHIFRDIKGRARLREKMYRQGQRVTQVRSKLKQTETELCEFHCMLVRTQFLKEIGCIDEALMNTKEHIDFCMTVRQAGGTVYFEPESLVTYVPESQLQWTDLHYYMLRWSDAWELESLAYLKQKWDLAEDMYFLQKYKALGWRRRKTILQPLIAQMTLGSNNRLLNKILMYGLLAPVEKLLNRYLTMRYAQRWFKPKQMIAPNSSLKTLDISPSLKY